MTEERWDQLARRLEDVARRDPRGYRARVAALAGLGYAYLLAVVVLLLAAIAGVVAAAAATTGLVVKLAFPLLALIVLVVRALWVRLPPPEGIELDRQSAGGLFDEVDRVRRVLDAPPVHHVILDAELNAAVVQIPRLGVFGWQRNYLVVGLPLLQALAPEQFRAVLAHELGHLSGNHGRFSGWIYRVRRTWGILLERLEEKGHWGAGIFRGFLRWYAPYFNAYSFALARADEYEADRASADAAGAPTAGAALVRLRIASWVMGARYWPGVFARADHEARPPLTAFAPLARELQALPTGAEVADVVRTALAEETGTADTHPSLTDRLRALGLSPEQLAEGALGAAGRSTSAASALLGAAEAALTRQVDEDWHEAVDASWREHHREACEAKQQLERLAARDHDGGLETDEVVALAHLTARFQDDRRALPIYRRAAASDPGNAPAQFAIGRILLAAGDEDGLRHLDRAMELDVQAIVPGAEIAYGYLMAGGRDAEAERYRERAEAHLEIEELAVAERETFEPGDDIEPHGLPSEDVQAIAWQLNDVDEVVGAYLARKRVEHLADEAPCYVLGIVVRLVLGKDDENKLVHRLARELRMPGEFFVICLEGRWRETRERMEYLSGGAVYGAALGTTAGRYG
jgi:Zn-dependent protease with chaperone function